MRKPLLVGFFVFIIVAGSAVVASWFMQSSAMKQSIEQAIARINQEQPYITYDSIAVSGFPTHVTVAIVNPRFSGRIDQLVLKLQQASGEPARTPLPEWQQDMALTGEILFTVNALSDQYSMAMNGQWKSSGQIAGQPTAEIVTPASVETVCSLGLARGSFFSNLWDFRILDEDGKQFMQDFRTFDCGSTAYTSVDPKTNATISSAGPSRIYIANTPEGGQQNIRFFLKISDAEITADGDKMIAAYLALMPDYPFPALFSIYGKQNIEVNFSYTGPLDFATSKDVPLDVNLGTYSITNDMYNSKGHFHLTNQVNGDARNAALDMRFESNYSEHYDMLIKETVRNFLRHAATSNDPQMLQIRAFIGQRTPDETYTIVEPVIPHLHPFGTLIQSANASYVGNAMFSIGDLNLKDLTISTSLYGLTATGTAKTAQDSPFPQANFNILCTNCMQMVDDMLAYAMRVQGVMRTLNPEPPQTSPVTPELVKGVKKFLTLLATPSQGGTGNDMLYVIASNNTGNITIGGRNIMEVMALYREYVAQEMEPAAKDAVPPQGWKIE